MKKIMSFLSSVGERCGSAIGKVGVSLGSLSGKVFRSAANDMKRTKRTRAALVVVVAIVIAVIAGLIYWWVGPKPATENEPTSVIGQAKVYIVTTRECGNQCWDTKLFTDALVQKGIKIASKEFIHAGSWWPFGESHNFLKTYQIAKVPTVVVEFTGANQPDITKFFSPSLGQVINGRFVLTKILAPYYDLTAHKIKGIINVTYLTDKSCSECYDVRKHEIALKNLGADTTNARTVDISSNAGKDLIKKYNITKVPTLLLSGEVGEYSVLSQAWAEVGTIAADGTYIFTNLDLMGDSYKDLSTGQIIKATATQPVVGQ